MPCRRQVTLAVLISGWAHVLHGMYKPWGTGTAMYALQHGSLFVTSFIFLMGLLFKVNSVSPSSPVYGALTVIMLSLCLLFITCWVVLVIRQTAHRLPALTKRTAVQLRQFFHSTPTSLLRHGRSSAPTESTKDRSQPAAEVVVVPSSRARGHFSFRLRLSDLDSASNLTATGSLRGHRDAKMNAADDVQVAANDSDSKVDAGMVVGVVGPDDGHDSDASGLDHHGDVTAAAHGGASALSSLPAQPRQSGYRGSASNDSFLFSLSILRASARRRPPVGRGPAGNGTDSEREAKNGLGASMAAPLNLFNKIRLGLGPGGTTVARRSRGAKGPIRSSSSRRGEPVNGIGRTVPIVISSNPLVGAAPGRASSSGASASNNASIRVSGGLRSSVPNSLEPAGPMALIPSLGNATATDAIGDSGQFQVDGAENRMNAGTDRTAGGPLDTENQTAL